MALQHFVRWPAAAGPVPMRMTMAERENGRIVETAREARQGERGPSILMLLTVSTLLAAVILAILWFVFFQT